MTNVLDTKSVVVLKKPDEKTRVILTTITDDEFNLTIDYTFDFLLMDQDMKNLSSLLNQLDIPKDLTIKERICYYQLGLHK